MFKLKFSRLWWPSLRNWFSDCRWSHIFSIRESALIHRTRHMAHCLSYMASRNTNCKSKQLTTGRATALEKIMETGSDGSICLLVLYAPLRIRHPRDITRVSLTLAITLYCLRQSLLHFCQDILNQISCVLRQSCQMSCAPWKCDINRELQLSARN